MVFLITDVQIIPIRPQQGQIAFASCIFNHQFSFNNLAIHVRPDGGYRIVYPDHVLPNGKRISLFHPVSTEVGKAIESAIVQELECINTKCAQKVAKGPFVHGRIVGQSNF